MPVSVVLFYNEQHRYGFIKAEPCNVFFHASAVEGLPVKAGDAVKYEAAPEVRNSPRATVVRLMMQKSWRRLIASLGLPEPS